MAKQSSQIDLAVTVNALVDKISVQEAQLKKAVTQLEASLKKQRIDVDAPTKITPIVEADIAAFKREISKIKTALTRELKSTSQLGEVSLGIAEAIKKELETTSSKILPAEGKKVVQGLKNFVSELLKETDLTKGQKKNLLQGLLTIEGSTLASAKKTLNDFQKEVTDGTAKALENINRLKRSIDQQPERIKAFRSEALNGVSAGVAAARRDAEALLDLYKLLSRQSGNMALTKDTSKDIENLEMRIQMIKKAMSDLGRLNAMLVKDPGKAVDFGFTFEQGTQKMAVFREALNSTRQVLKGIKEEGSAVTDLGRATTKAAEAQAISDKAKIQASESYTRLLREQYNAQLALDKKTGDFTKSDTILKLLQAELDTRKALQQVSNSQADSAKKAAEAQAIADKAKLQASESYIRLLREQYNAQLAVDKKTGDFSKSDVILNRLQVELDQRKALQQITNKQIEGAAKYLEALKNVSNAAQLGSDLELKARQQLLSLMEKQSISGLRFTAEELNAEKSIIAELQQEIATRNTIAGLQKISADNVRALKAKNLSIQEQVNLLKAQYDVQLQLYGTESKQLPVLQRMIESRENLLVRMREEDSLRKKINSGLEVATNAELVSKEKALRAYKALEDVIIRGGEAARQRFMAEAEYVNRRIRELESEIALTKQLEVEKENLARIQKSFTSFEQGRQTLAQGGLSTGQYKEAVAQIELFKKSLTELERLAKSTDANIATSATHMLSVYKQEADAINVLVENEKHLIAIRNAERKLVTAQTDENRLKALRQQAAAIQELITALHNQGQASSRIAVHLQNEHAQLTSKIHATKEAIAENRSLESSYLKLGNAFRSFLRYGVEFAAFYKAQQAITGVVTSVVELEDAFKTVQAVAGATSAEMESVIASIKKVAIDTEFSTNQIAEAAQTLAQAGLAIQDVSAALDSTAKFASATGTSLRTSADIMTTMKNVFQDMRFDQIADQLTSTINLSKLTGEGLSTILSRAVEVSDTFKIVPEQMQAAFAVLKNAGIKDSTISTGYRQALLELFSPDDKLLTYLQSRYAEMGQSLSKETISAMFQSFTREKNPILAVIAELDKLGFATTHASEAARVFDVRAKNVIDVLIKQKDSFASLTTQITAHGTAAQGSQTQMESLGRSWANLGSVIDVVATERLGGMMHSLEKIVDVMSDVIQKSGEASNAFTRITGSSGTAAASITGLLAGIGKFVTSGSLVKGGAAGIGVAAITNVIDTLVTDFSKRFGDGVANGVSKVLEAVSMVFTGALLWKQLSARITTSVATAATSLLPPYAKLVVAAVGVLGAAMASLSESVASRIQAIRNDLEKAKADIDTAKAKQAERQADKDAFDKLLFATERTSASLQDFIDTNTNAVGNIADIASSAAEDLRGKSLDLEGTQLKDSIDRLKKEVGGLSASFNPDDYADNIRKVNEIVAQWDGERLKYFDQITKAYETEDSKRTDDQKNVIKAFEGMSESQKSLLLREITSLDDVKAFTDKEEGFAPRFMEQVLKPVQISTDTYLKEQADLAKNLVAQAVKDDEFGKLYSEILTTFKQGNVELLDALEKEIENALVRAEKENKRVNALRADKGLAPIITQDVLELNKSNKLVITNRMSAADAAITKSISALEDIAAHYSNVKDSFISSLSPEEMNQLGIEQNAVKQHVTELKDVTAQVPAEWKKIYDTAISQGMSYRETYQYLESQKKIYKDIPPAVQELLDITKKQADLQDNSNKLIWEKLQKESEVNAQIETSKQKQEELRVRQDEYTKLLETGNLNEAQRNDIRSKSKDLETEQKSLATEINNLQAKGLEARKETDNAVQDQLKLQQQYNENWKKLLKDQDAKDRTTQKSIDALNAERNNLFAQGNTELSRAIEIDKKIYELKVQEEEARQRAILASLNQNDEFRKKFSEYSNNLAALAEYLKGPEGTAWMESMPALKDGLQGLVGSVDKTRSAFDEFTTNLEQDYAKLSAEMKQKLDQSTKIAETQFAAQTQSINVNPQLAGNEAEREKQLTNVIITELATRNAAQQSYFSTLQKERDNLHLKELEQIKSAGMTEQAAKDRLKQINKAYYEGKLSLMLSDVDAHKQNLDKLYAEESKHAARVRALDNELKSLKRSDQDEVNSIIRDTLSQEDQMYFDRKNALQEFYDAKKMLSQGDYENGRSIIDKAISDQAAYAREVSQAEMEGRAAYGATRIALSDLSAMQKERYDAVKKQRDIEDAARKKAEEAARLELLSINNLSIAITNLSKLISNTGKVDLGLQAQIDLAKQLNAEASKLPQQGGGGAPKAISSSAVTPESMGASYTKDLEAQRAFYNGLVLTNAELAKHGSEIVKIIDAQGKVQLTTAQVASTMDLEGKSVMLLNDATTTANVTHSNLAASTEAVGQKAAAAAPGVDTLGASVNNLPKETNIAVNADTTQATNDVATVDAQTTNLDGKQANVTVTAEADQAVTKVDHVDTKTTELDEKQTMPIIDADATPAEEELNSILDFFTQVFNNLNSWRLPISADTTAVYNAIAGIDANLSQPRYMTVYVNEVRQGGGGAPAGGAPAGDGGGIGGGGYASGGLIRGKGTGTSDSIPAMLSNGEYVIPADAVKKVGVDYLNKLRDGEVRQFAKGGYASAGSKTSKDDNVALQILNGTFNRTTDDPAFLEFIKSSPKGSVIGVRSDSRDLERIKAQVAQQGGVAVATHLNVDYLAAVQAITGQRRSADNHWFGGTLGGKEHILRIFSKDEVEKLREEALKATEDKKSTKAEKTQKSESSKDTTATPADTTPADPSQRDYTLLWNDVKTRTDKNGFQLSDATKQELYAMAMRFFNGEFNNPSDSAFASRFRDRGKMSKKDILQELIDQSSIKYYSDIMDKSRVDVPVGMSTAGGGNAWVSDTKTQASAPTGGVFSKDRYPTVSGMAKLSSAVNTSVDSTQKEASVQSKAYTITIRSDLGSSASLQGSSQQVDNLLGVLKSIKGVTIS